MFLCFFCVFKSNPTKAAKIIHKNAIIYVHGQMPHGVIKRLRDLKCAIFAWKDAINFGKICKNL